jgi:hypothetical protein
MVSAKFALVLVARTSLQAFAQGGGGAAGGGAGARSGREFACYGDCWRRISLIQHVRRGDSNPVQQRPVPESDRTGRRSGRV